MFEKDLKIGLLLDFYGDILDERKHEVLQMYYNEDFSLAEISQLVGISRQGVRDLVKRASADLLFYEEKLGLYEHFEKLKAAADRTEQIAQKSEIPEELRESIKALADLTRY